MRNLSKIARAFYGLIYAICFAVAFFTALALVSDPPEPKLVLVCPVAHSCDGIQIDRAPAERDRSAR